MPDPIYRYHNCNLQAPKFKCLEFHTNELSYDIVTPSLILVQNNHLDSNTIHLIAPTALSQTNCAGELSVYLRNNLLNMVHVLTFLVAKSNNVLNTDTCINYQTFGNFTVTVSYLNNNSIQLTLNAPAQCYWIFRGV